MGQKGGGSGRIRTCETFRSAPLAPGCLRPLGHASDRVWCGRNGAPGRIRTPNLQIRSLVLCPVELRALGITLLQPGLGGGLGEIGLPMGWPTGFEPVSQGPQPCVLGRWTMATIGTGGSAWSRTTCGQIKSPLPGRWAIRCGSEGMGRSRAVVGWGARPGLEPAASGLGFRCPFQSGLGREGVEMARPAGVEPTAFGSGG
jgi:hypothetical protein